MGLHLTEWRLLKNIEERVIILANFLTYMIGFLITDTIHLQAGFSIFLSLEDMRAKKESLDYCPIACLVVV